MGKWLAKFLDDTHEIEPHIPHTLPDFGTVWSLSVQLSDTLAEISPPQVVEPPASPLPRHCFVTYTDRQGHLCGGWDDRQRATVTQCEWTGRGWSIHLSDGQTIPFAAVRCVGQTNEQGELIAAWSVREHGYDGQGKRPDDREAIQQAVTEV
jgi:hypothetical protein